MTCLFHGSPSWTRTNVPSTSCPALATDSTLCCRLNASRPLCAPRQTNGVWLRCCAGSLFRASFTKQKEIPDIRHLFVGSPSWTRTNDPAVNSRMLYRLSYRGILNCATLLALLKYISTIRKFCQRFFRKNTKHFSKKLHVGFGTAFCRCLRDFSFIDGAFVYNSLDRRH